MTTPEQPVSPEKIAAACPDCDGQGWTQGTDYEDQCCGGSDWECGARGCTGPDQIQVPTQEQCERCLGSGLAEREKGGNHGK